MAVINYCTLIQISLKFILNSPIEKYVSFGWDKGLAPNRRQAIILTNDDTVYWCIYASLDLDGSTFYHT